LAQDGGNRDYQKPLIRLRKAELEASIDKVLFIIGGSDN
jgi:hypothetical protein